MADEKPKKKPAGGQRAKARAAAPRKPRANGRVTTTPVDTPELKQAVGAATEVLQLSPHMQVFVAEYIASQSGPKAYKAAFPTCSWSTARTEYQRIMAMPEITAAIAAGTVAIARNIEWSAEEVLRRLGVLASAKASDLVQVRVGACRYCWGEGFRYHYTPAEFERAEQEHAKLVELDKASGDFDPKGGVGFDRNAPANPQCPECGGDGVARVVHMDTRELSPEALSLYAGAKVTKDGFEVKLHDSTAALVNVGRVMGAFKDGIKLSGEVKHSLADELRAELAQRGSRLQPGGGSE